MAKKFAALRARMSPESQACTEAKAQAMLAEMPLNELRQARGLSRKMLAEGNRSAPPPHGLGSKAQATDSLAPSPLVGEGWGEGSKGYPFSIQSRAISKRSRFITLSQAATKSRTNFSWASSQA